MSDKPILWKFTSKELIERSILLIGMVSMYYGLVGEIRDYKIQNEADKKLLEYRITAIEKENSKQVYTEPNSAILPQSPRIKRNPLLIINNE